MKKPKISPSSVSVGNLESPNSKVAGIDIGAKEHWVAISKTLDSKPIRCYGSQTEELHLLAQWLIDRGIESVAMESTGVYWGALYDVLESYGLEVCLVNGRHMKNVPGRKRDDWDSEWLRKLHSCGLLSASFIPASEIRALRAYVRQRQSVEKGKSTALQHIGKALVQMNITLQQWISDIEGKTAMKIIRAINQGERDSEKLAAMRHANMKASVSELAASLRGIWRQEYLFNLGQSLQAYDFYKGQMLHCEKAIELTLSQLQAGEAQTLAAIETFRSKKKTRAARKNQYHFELKTYGTEIFGVDLTQIDGIEEDTVLTILSECGRDFSKWKSKGHFTSWLGLAPRNKISGGKVIGHQKIKTTNRLNTSLRLCARSLHHNKSALGAQARRLKARCGPQIATKAMARKLAEIIYIMITKQVPYQKQTQEQYDDQFKAQRLKRLTKEAQKLGYILEENKSSNNE